MTNRRDAVDNDLWAVERNREVEPSILLLLHYY